jgi:hypothetical protein
MIPMAVNSNGNSDPPRCLQGSSTHSQASSCPRFASQPFHCLVNYLNPILYRVGPVGQFRDSALRPRSRV